MLLDAEDGLPTLNNLNILQEQALIYARQLSILYRQRKVQRQQLEEGMAQLTQLQEQTAAYAQDISQLIRLEREQARQLQDAMGSLTTTYDATVTALVTALDVRDLGTGGHSQRVVSYTLAIADEIGWPPDHREELGRGALLHDIGKIGVRDSILRKRGPLSPRQREEMRKHCLWGYNILKDIPFLRGATDIVYAHHERYDGTGYPRGLSGAAIPLGARIFAIADSLDAMTSARPYRQVIGFDEATEEIEAGAGTQFDPEAVYAFLQAMDEGRIGGIRVGGNYA